MSKRTDTTAPGDADLPTSPYAPTLLTVAGVALLQSTLLPLATSGWPVGGAPVANTDDVVSGLLAWAAVTSAAWLTAGAGLTALALLPGAAGRGAARLAHALTPALVRRGLALLLGTGLGTVSPPLGPVMAASAVSTAAQVPSAGARSAGSDAPTAAPTSVGADADPARPPHAEDDASPLEIGGPSPGYRPTVGPAAAKGAGPDPRWRPSRPVRAADPQASALLAPAPRAAEVPDDVVTVRRGDSLWSLAARHLGPGASDREVARAWPQWYALNADVIGRDPDLIRPGQQLRIPNPGDHR